MKDQSLTPVIAGVMLALTVVAAVIGAVDASQPFPEEAKAPPALVSTNRPLVAEWSGITIP